MHTSTARRYVVTVSGNGRTTLILSDLPNKRNAIRMARAHLARYSKPSGRDLDGPARADVRVVTGRGETERRVLIYQAHWTAGGIVVDEL